MSKLKVPISCQGNVFPFMKEKRKGSIVIVSSDQAIIAKTNRFACNSSKWEIASMARTLALDYAQSGICCNKVSLKKSTES